MADELFLEIVTPEEVAFSGKIEDVTIPGSEGEFGVLAGHAALLSGINFGELNYTEGNKKTYYAIDTGYAEVASDKVTVLVESAQRADVIDRDKAQKDKEMAEQKLARISGDDPDYEKTVSIIEKEGNRLKVSENA